MKKILSIILILIALIMIFLSFKIEVLAPALTGIGFIVIALLFNTRK